MQQQSQPRCPGPDARQRSGQKKGHKHSELQWTVPTELSTCGKTSSPNWHTVCNKPVLESTRRNSANSILFTIRGMTALLFLLCTAVETFLLLTRRKPPLLQIARHLSATAALSVQNSSQFLGCLSFRMWFHLEAGSEMWLSAHPVTQTTGCALVQVLAHVLLLISSYFWEFWIHLLVSDLLTEFKSECFEHKKLLFFKK